MNCTITRSSALVLAWHRYMLHFRKVNGHPPLPSIGSSSTITRATVSTIASHWIVLGQHGVKGLCHCLALGPASMPQNEGLCPCQAMGRKSVSQDQGPLPWPSNGTCFTITRPTASAFAGHWVMPLCPKIKGFPPSLALDGASLSHDRGPLPSPSIGPYLTMARCPCQASSQLHYFKIKGICRSIGSHFTITISIAPSLA